MSSSVISVKQFAKEFSGKRVVDDLSFDVQPGEIFAFLGANGSGKTTTVRCLLNILPSTAGELLVFGKSYHPTDAVAVGYLPEERGLYLNITPLEVMTYFGELKGLTHAAAQSWSAEYLERVGLADKATTRLKKLSSGQQQKIQLGITIINSPKLLILDEPTKGLDPVNQQLLMDMLLDLNKKGSTIVFITHQMEEVEKIADRLVMIKNGRRVLYGPVGEVKESFGTNRIQLEFSGKMPTNPKLFSATVTTNTADLTPADGVSAQDILSYLVAQKLNVRKFVVTTPSLNEIFVTISKDARY